MRKPLSSNLSLRQRVGALTADQVRYAARQFNLDGRKFPAGLADSQKQDVWIDLDDGTGPQPYAPKVILAYATGGTLPEKEGYAVNGPWRAKLDALGFPVLLKGQPPAPGQDCRGSQDGSNVAGSSRAATLTASNIRDAARDFRAADRLPPAGFGASTAENVWIDLSDGTGPQDYPPKVIVALAAARSGLRLAPNDIAGAARKRTWLPLLEQLGFPVLRKGEVPSADQDCRGTDLAASRVWPEPTALTRERVLDAARAWHAQPNDFRVAHAAHEWEVRIGDHAYPVKAICILAYLNLGYDQGAIKKWKKGGRNSPWDQRIEALGFPIHAKIDSEELDLESFLERENVPTEVVREVLARLTQGSFRKDLIAARRGLEQCDVTGIAVPEVLRAGHIHRWADCKGTPHMRRDPANGLLLAAHLDALFEKGMIIFADDGQMLIWPSLSPRDRQLLQLVEPQGLTFKPSQQQQRYLAMHRARVAGEGKTGHA